MRRISVIATIILYVTAFVSPAANPPRANAATPAEGAISPEVVRALGIGRPTGISPTEASLAVARAVEQSLASGLGGPSQTQPGCPLTWRRTRHFPLL